MPKAQAADAPRRTRTSLGCALRTALPQLCRTHYILRCPGCAVRTATPGGTPGREWVAKNWGAAMGFLNAVSAIAEEEGHHPDLHLTGWRRTLTLSLSLSLSLSLPLPLPLPLSLTRWRNVRIDLSTHAIGGRSSLFNARRPGHGKPAARGARCPRACARPPLRAAEPPGCRASGLQSLWAAEQSYRPLGRPGPAGQPWPLDGSRLSPRRHPREIGRQGELQAVDPWVSSPRRAWRGEVAYPRGRASSTA